MKVVIPYTKGAIEITKTPGESIVNLHESYLEFKVYESVSVHDDDLGIDKFIDVHLYGFILKNKISSVEVFYDNKQERFMIEVSGTDASFVRPVPSQEFGLNLQQDILSWLIK